MDEHGKRCLWLWIAGCRSLAVGADVTRVRCLALWAALLVAGGVYLGALEFVPKQAGQRFAQVVGVMMVFWGVACLFGASAGAADPFKPLAGLAAGGSSEQRQGREVRWQPVKSTADVEQAMASASGPVILDLYADWCISCKVMERTVFPEPAVAEKLVQFTLLRADVTANDDQDQMLLKRYGLLAHQVWFFRRRWQRVRRI